MHALLMLIVFLFPSALHAQEIILEHDCKVPVEHVPNSDVEYKPEEGVVPADLNTTLKALDYPIEIPVTIDFIKWLELDVPDELAAAGELEAKPAHFTFYEDGRLEYNGQDISKRASVICRDQEATDKTLSPEQQEILEKLAREAKANGQAEAAVVPSPPETSVDDHQALGEAIEGQSP